MRAAFACRLSGQAGVTGGAAAGNAIVVEVDHGPVTGAGVAVLTGQIGSQVRSTFAACLSGQTGMTVGATAGYTVVVEVNDCPVAGAGVAALTRQVGG